MTQYQKAHEMVKKGLMTVRSLPDRPEVEIFCYSRDAFRGRNWNETTLTHRGALYVNGVRVNKAFDKIFNIGEVEEASFDIIEKRMATESYDVMHKSNGHLLICSAWVNEDSQWELIWHTKGSVANKDNDLLNKDIEIVTKEGGLQSKIISFLYGKQGISSTTTFMFEAIVEHDKHTLYESDKERYGLDGDGFVLLGINSYANDLGRWLDAPMGVLSQFSDLLGFTVVKSFTDLPESLDDWYNHTDTEGYVIRFHSDNYRVKVKTKEYWSMRFKKDLRPENILGMFRTAGFDRIEDRLPEEVAKQLMELIENRFKKWLKVEHPTFDIASEDRTVISQMDDISSIQKALKLASLDDKYEATVTKMLRSKSTRRAFVDSVLSTPIYLEWMEHDINQIINNIGKN